MGNGYLTIGKVSKPHGLRGQVKALVGPDSLEHLQPGRSIWLGYPDRLRQVEIETRAVRGRTCILGFSGVGDRNAAEALVGADIQISAEDLPELPEGEYYWHQVAGLRVVSEEGQFLGTLQDMFSTPAHDIWVARSPGQEVFIPAVAEVVLAVDREGNEVRVRNGPEWWEGDGH